MSTHKRGKRSGNRGNDFRPSRGYSAFATYHHPEQSTTNTAIVGSSAVYYECSDVHETVEDHIVPRVSLTQSQHLAIFPTVERKIVNERQRDTMSGELTTVGNPAIVWRSDRTLLRRGKPEQLNALKLFRETSHTKIRQFEREEPATLEIPTDLDVDL